jgi:poly-gamma-glutamate synthesis protein (capsule biosynthesis protein)
MAIQDKLREGDIVFTDLETAVSGPGAGPPTREGGVFHAAGADALRCLKKIGVSLAATSNNHAWDLGPGGIMLGVRTLDELGIAHAGSGPDLEAASRPGWQHSMNGMVALVAGATGAIRIGGAATATRAGVNELRMAGDDLDAGDVARMLASIAAARRAGGAVIAYLHNHHWQPDPAETPPWQRRFARQCVDAGAAVFVSHGPPLLQGVELYRGTPLFHGLGSFIFQTRKTGDAYGTANWQSVMVKATFAAGRFESAMLYPLILDSRRRSGDAFTNGTPAIAQGKEGQAILDHFSHLSNNLGTSIKLSRNAGLLENGVSLIIARRGL